MLQLFGLVLALQFVAFSIASLPATLLFQTPDGSALENLAVRASSELVVASSQSPTLFTFDPIADNPTLNGVVTFPDADGLLGIAEYRPDVFAVVACKVNFTALAAVPGTVAIWSVDFSDGAPTARRAATIPQAGLANGLTAVPGVPDVVLAADSIRGLAWEVNLLTGGVRVFLESEATSVPMGPGDPSPALGINGVHVQGGFLYFTNSQRGTLSRTPLVPGGPVQLLGTGSFDDFILDKQGRAWVTNNPSSLSLISPLKNGSFVEETVVDTVLIDPSAVAFGRIGGKMTKTLFVTTRAGQLVSVDTSAEGA
ncbi:hypothetical protein FB45DRAFT_841348 [Roridomyces roridus]|uniref:SMP-30/Gluconolactonase/LRE-like region domain-containing protein n=1 Tax=Roridomyces roridus TaxID=1738132 RepID=A0AAD7BBM4_9AGAR|nr:hypothetical protein FB45DRAFT_841348 [Roridomyces roridus]